MPDSSLEPDSDLPPPGSRWGAGVQSVLPYLTKSLQAKPAVPPVAREQRQEGPRVGTQDGEHPQA